VKIAICPGSFDPITRGHLDIITRASKLFDKVIVVVLTNFNKTNTGVFSKDERAEMIKIVTSGLENVEVDTYEGLLADYASVKHADVIVKGLRAVSDFESEFQMALANKQLNHNVETMFLTTSSEYMYLSSSVVKQIAYFGGDISNLVPAEIEQIIAERLKR